MINNNRKEINMSKWNRVILCGGDSDYKAGQLTTGENIRLMNTTLKAEGKSIIKYAIIREWSAYKVWQDDTNYAKFVRELFTSGKMDKYLEERGGSLLRINRVSQEYSD